MTTYDYRSLNITDLSISFGSRQVLRDVNLSIRQRKISAILGPSGCGKSTLLKAITGQITPSHGAVTFNDEIVHDMPTGQLTAYRKNLAMLFQHSALFSHLTIFENVAFPLREHFQLDEDLIHSMVLLRLESVGLSHATNLYPNQLSGGMIKRAALARAMVTEPEILLCDEPLTGQDPINCRYIIDWIKYQTHCLDTTTVVVTHDIHLLKTLADDVYIILDGTIAFAGTVDALFKSRQAQVSDFLRGIASKPRSASTLFAETL